jgi:hypothetical protein
VGIQSDARSALDRLRPPLRVHDLAIDQLCRSAAVSARTRSAHPHTRTLEVVLRELLVLKVEERRVERLRARLVRGVVVRGEVRVRERAVDVDARAGAEREQAREQVRGLRARLGEQLRERPLLPERQRADVLARARGRDRVEVVQRRRPQHVQDDRQLVVICGPVSAGMHTYREKGPHSRGPGRAAGRRASPRARTRRTTCRSRACTP